MTTLLSPGEIAAALELRDLSDPDGGPHAMQILIAKAVDALAARWNCRTRLRRSSPLVAVEDNYDRLGYDPAAVTRDGRYTRYVSDTVMLRSHTSAGIPPALRYLAAEPALPGDVLIVLPGLVYRRDAIDRLHCRHPAAPRRGPADRRADGRPFPWRAVSTLPAVRRDLSIVTIRRWTTSCSAIWRVPRWARTPTCWRASRCAPSPLTRRSRMRPESGWAPRPGQANALVRIVLRPLDPDAHRRRSQRAPGPRPRGAVPAGAV